MSSARMIPNPPRQRFWKRPVYCPVPKSPLITPTTERVSAVS